MEHSHLNHIPVSLDQLLHYRRAYDRELFAITEGQGKVRLLVHSVPGTMISSGPYHLSQIENLRPYLNKPIPRESLMIRTHDFGDISTWADEQNSDYTLSPYAGTKLVISSIVTRSPEDVDLAANPITYSVYKSLDGVTPVTAETPPIISTTYDSLRSLIMQSNSPVDLNMLPIDGTMIPVVDIRFRYALGEVEEFSKLSLSASLNEHIKATLADAGSPLNRTDAAGPASPVYAWFNCARVPDF